MDKTIKPWGSELLVACNSHYALKDISMRAGTRSSLQSHRQKHETIYVLSGRISLERNPPGGQVEIQEYTSGQAYSIEPGVVHRVTVLEDARLIEVSTPQLDDVIRHADDFGRAG